MRRVRSKKLSENNNNNNKIQDNNKFDSTVTIKTAGTQAVKKELLD
jgi:hypothetical protein